MRVKDICSLPRKCVQLERLETCGNQISCVPGKQLQQPTQYILLAKLFYEDYEEKMSNGINLHSKTSRLSIYVIKHSSTSSASSYLGIENLKNSNSCGSSMHWHWLNPLVWLLWHMYSGNKAQALELSSGLTLVSGEGTLHPWWWWLGGGQGSWADSPARPTGKCQRLQLCLRDCTWQTSLPHYQGSSKHCSNAVNHGWQCGCGLLLFVCGFCLFVFPSIFLQLQKDSL